jgi:hypothetical protein
MCVYRLWFGKKYYIGSSTDLEKRMKLHYRKIMDCFSGKGIGRNSQTNIMYHLIENPLITEGLVEILEFGKTEEELVFLEDKWLRPSFTDQNCLNQCKHTTRRINGVLVRNS